ncbi:hypothetical protein RvY_17637 [Ramazzottius varieornatus]|uniref:Uncharacterized protein n=1 Tax=Ramazzottius varieornatus TaxID=947166 RepID=A0A1D1W2U7_RAMVA|nr:hypothetical protein RvY_17637 [Ramazzottius varieornatus]
MDEGTKYALGAFLQMAICWLPTNSETLAAGIQNGYCNRAF